MINSKSLKSEILTAYNENQSQLIDTQTQLRIALIWAISSTVLLICL